MADYTCQALVSTLLLAHFPTDKIVGEEDSGELQTPANLVTKNQIVRLCNEALGEKLAGSEESEWDNVKQAVSTRGGWGEKEWLGIIDEGNSEGGPLGRTLSSPACPVGCLRLALTSPCLYRSLGT